MKIEDQVVSKELSEKLAKVGYPQDGLWSWYVAHDGYCCGPTNINAIEEELIRECIAPTVVELAVWLPGTLMDGNANKLMIAKGDDEYMVGYFDWVGRYGEGYWYERFSLRLKSLPNAMAEVVLWLHKEKHITFEDKKK